MLNTLQFSDSRIVRVNPAYTTQICFVCGQKVLKTLADRIHKCPVCRVELDRDYNAIDLWDHNNNIIKT